MADKTPEKAEKKLVPLAEHNARIAERTPQAKPEPNGVECPNCKKELTDTEPGKVTKTNGPSYTAVACPACGYFGIRNVEPQ